MVISTAKKLYIYNQALLQLESRQLSSLTENRKPRRVLDSLWGNSDELVMQALSLGGWNFAMRVSQLTSDGVPNPQFGWQYAFEKPSDFVRLEAISLNERFNPGLVGEQYADENGYWLVDHQTIYVKYVSSDPDYGLDDSKWSPNFDKYLYSYLAFHGASPITHSSSKMKEMEQFHKDAMAQAKSRDAMDEGPKQKAPGKWLRSRQRRIGRDNYNSGNLIG